MEVKKQYQKLYFIGFIIIILISFSINAQEDKFKIDIEVIESLEKTNKADVIIFLKDTSNIKMEGSKSDKYLKLMQRAEYFKDIQRSILSRFRNGEFKVTYQYSVVNGFAGQITKDGFNKIKDDPIVRRIYIDAGEDYPELSQSRIVINADDVESLGYDGQGQTICVIDTGINYSHPNLGYCTSSQFLAGTCNKVVGGYDFFSDDDNPMDARGHGTEVAGIAAANGTINGVAPKARLVAIKICGSSSQGCASPSAQIAAYNWCVHNASIFNINVITTSIGGQILYNSYCNDDPRTTIIGEAISMGIIVIKSSGNNGSIVGVTAPGCVENVTVVGATYDANVGGITWTTPNPNCTDNPTYADLLACGSNRADFIDVLLAPGGEITTTSLGGGTTGVFGTSFAAPHVAGAAAILKQINGNLTPSQIELALKGTGKPVWDTRKNKYYSRIDVLKAVQTRWFWDNLYEDWPHFMHDLGRTGFTLLKGDLTSSSNSVSWTSAGSTDTDFWDDAYITEIDGIDDGEEIIVATSNFTYGKGRIYLLDGDTNTQIWTYTLNSGPCYGGDEA